MVTLTRITNPNVYSAPSDWSDDEDDTLYSHFATRAPNADLQRLAKPADDLELYRTSVGQDRHKRQNADFLARFQQHNAAMEQAREEASQQRLREHEAAVNRLRDELARLDLERQKQEAKIKEQYEKEVKETQAAMEAAIALDKKRAAEAEARQKAKQTADAEKARRDAEKAQADKLKAESEAKEKEKQALLEKHGKTGSVHGHQEAERYIAAILHYQQTYRPKLRSDQAFRKALFNKRMLLKRNFQQLQLKADVVDERFAILRDGLLAMKSQGDDAYHCLLNCICKSFLQQIRLEVDRFNAGCYFYAQLAMKLCATVPIFTEYLLGRLYKRCPLLIPNFYDDPSMSVTERKQKLRYEPDDDKFQTTENYLAYQQAYIMFFAALVQTPNAPNLINPVGVEHGWRYLARVCNMQPTRPLHANILSAFLHVAAPALLQAFPNQMPKALRLIRQELYPKIPRDPENNNASQLTRLQWHLDEYFNTGRYPQLPATVDAQ